MTILLKRKSDGRVIRHPLVGNISFEENRIVLTDDPRLDRISVTYLSADEYEFIRITEDMIETKGGIEARVSNKQVARRYCEMVLGEEK